MPSTLSLPVEFSFTQNFREAFRAAFVNVTGAVFVKPDIQGWVNKYPIDSGFPTFDYRPSGSPTTLTWRFTIPLEVQFPEPVRRIKIVGERDNVLLEGNLEQPFVKMRDYPGVLLLNWTF